MEVRICSTPASNAGRSRLVVHVSGAGPTQGGPGHGRAGRTSANRAHTGGPEKGSTTAQNPWESSAARSVVTSRSPVASRPPTTASGGALGIDPDDTPTILAHEPLASHQP